MTEDYIVEFDYQTDLQFGTDYWTHGSETVQVFLSNGACEKCNHEMAMKQIEKDYPGCKIRKVIYC